jgi:hypothetical protein
MWPSTPCDMLRDLYGSDEVLDGDGMWHPGEGSDISVYDPDCAQPLVDAGLVRQLNIPGCKYAYCLTSKGKEAAEMLLCHRTFGRFAMPDWLMDEIAGQGASASPGQTAAPRKPGDRQPAVDAR